MRIQRIDITGFKSFMERVVFTFDDGITAVVGPNGCGKSNVVDAIRWVMGEQSAKSLRGRGMEDVIFKGSEAHAPLSMAEVTLTFSVEEHDNLPATLKGLPEVSVTRRLFRGGDSEYQLNMTPCRLLDVSDLFYGTGVGRGAYSVIEQGRVGQIVSARPEDRRGFIEEAAGVSKYKARRRVAERKMEYTRQNLLRISDIGRELTKRLDSLERQAKKAEKHRALKSEIRGIELHSASHRWLDLRARLVALTEEVAPLTSEAQAAQSHAHGLEQAIVAQRADSEDLALRLETAQLQLHTLEAADTLDAQKATHTSELLDSAGARIAALEVDCQALQARADTLRAEARAAEAALEELDLQAREEEVAMAAKEEEGRRLRETLQLAERALATEQAKAEALIAAQRSTETSLASLQERLHAHRDRRDSLETEAAALEVEAAQVEGSRSESASRIEEHRKAASELAERRGSEEALLLNTREQLAEHEVLVIAKREDLAEKRSRLATLTALQREYEGYDRGVREMMSMPRREIFGVVADLVSTDARYDRAIEAALGERLQHVVVLNADSAFAFAAQQAEHGRATFIPSATDEGQPLEVEGDEAVLATAGSVVRVSNPDATAVVAKLLAGIVIASDLQAARSLSKRQPAMTIVTLQGEVVRPGAVVTGGIPEGPAVGALQKKREVEALAEGVSLAEASFNEVITRYYGYQKSVSQTEGVLKGLEKNERHQEVQRTGHERDLHQANERLARLRELRAAKAEEMQVSASLAASLAAEESNLRSNFSEDSSTLAALRERITVREADLAALTDQVEAHRAISVGMQVAVAAAAERRLACHQRGQALVRQAEESASRISESQRLAGEEALRVDELAKRFRGIQADRSQRAEELLRAREVADGLKALWTACTERLRRDDATLREYRATVELQATRLKTLAITQTEMTMALEHIEAGVWERYALPVGAALHEFHAAPRLQASAEAKLSMLRSAIERMGEVNIAAIEELQEVRERTQLLDAQRLDLEQSLERLLRAIDRIDDTSRARFKEAFALIDQKFQAVFPRLFGGGRASLTLVPGGPGEEPGVEILAQPPGKKLQSMSLLSGGETALTAVSLIFAIFLIKPAPFCLLDEVDAPLDEGNVGRYNAIVKELSRTTQFILITHNKRTMEVADALYGVTMEEPGVSKLVSVRIRDTAENSNRNVA